MKGGLGYETKMVRIVKERLEKVVFVVAVGIFGCRSVVEIQCKSDTVVGVIVCLESGCVIWWSG